MTYKNITLTTLAPVMKRGCSSSSSNFDQSDSAISIHDWFQDKEYDLTILHTNENPDVFTATTHLRNYLNTNFTLQHSKQIHRLISLISRKK